VHIRHIAQNALKAKNEHHPELASKVALNTWIEMAFNRSLKKFNPSFQLVWLF
jgi:hypothetical protein